VKENSRVMIDEERSLVSTAAAAAGKEVTTG
jgi:hypothetical protein